MAKLGDQIKEELENFGLDSPEDDVMNKLTGLCSTLAIKPSDFADQWMAFSVNNCNLDLDMDGLSKFEKFKMTKNQSPMVKKERRSVVNAATHIGELFDDILDAYLPVTSRPTTSPLSQKRPLESPSSFRVPKISKTPVRSGHHVSRMVSRDLPCSLSPVNASPSQTYSQRKGSGDIMCTFNEGGLVPVTAWSGQGAVNVSLSPLTLSKPYQYMFQKMSMKAEALDEHVETMGDMLAAQHSVQFDNLARAEQGECRVVGRVCCDSQGKMNASSVVLEGSLETSYGKRVSVDLSQLERYALFPGQIVAMEGTNPTGRKFIATKILDPVPLKKKVITSDKAVTIFGACGPYTSQDSLSYEPLSDLLNKVQEDKPDVLILLGPFVDVKHPLVEKCDVGDVTLESLFEGQISHILQNIPPTTHLVVAPSQRDTSCHSVYPQPPPELNKTSPNLTLASDPSVLEINGVSLALTSTDVLFHLSSEEISHPPGSDRMGRLAGHLLHQHNFYPLHPPSEDVNIDYPYFIKHAFFESKPDILLLPSDLRYFVKNVMDTVVINPGKLGKGSGTYFKLYVKGPQQISNSTFVNIVKI